MPFNPFSALTAKIFGGSTVLLAIALALTFAWGKAGWRSADSYELAFKTQKTAMEAAQSAALARAQAANIRAEIETADLARKADYAENEVVDLRAAADRFRDARSLWAQAPRCAPGGPASAAPAGPAPDRDGPGDDAVVLTKPEYEQFVSNSVRLEKVRLWGESLILTKRAVTADDFAKLNALFGQPEKP